MLTIIGYRAMFLTYILQIAYIIKPSFNSRGHSSKKNRQNVGVNTFCLFICK